MNTTIHHAIVKQAAKLGATIAAVDGAFTVTMSDGTVHTANTAKAAMALALGKPERAPKPAKGKAKKSRKARATEEGDEDDEEGETKSKSVIPAKYKARYKPHHDTCGDMFVQAMFVFLHPDGEDLDIGRFTKLARDNGIDPTSWNHLKNKDGGPNVGMWRMNLGNKLRALYRQGKSVRIGTEELVKPAE